MPRNMDLVTARDLAEVLDLSVETIWRYTREGRIPHIKLGRKQYRYRVDDVTSSLIQEGSSQYAPKGALKLTYQDYLALPEEPGYRHEILDGILVKEPSPSVAHQRVTRRLLRILEDYFWEVDHAGEVFIAPLDVTFDDVSVVQPDLFYVCGEKKCIVKDARVDGPPTLVVEVLSPSTNRRDRLQKLRIYQNAGVQHYWLADPGEKTLECFSLLDGLYSLVTAGMNEELMEHPEFQGLSVALGDLWRGAM